MCLSPAGVAICTRMQRKESLGPHSVASGVYTEYSISRAYMYVAPFRAYVSTTFHVILLRYALSLNIAGVCDGNNYGSGL